MPRVLIAGCGYVGSAAAKLAPPTELGPALEHTRLLFVAVGTPPTYSGDADLSAVWTVVDELPVIERPCTVVMKSHTTAAAIAITRNERQAPTIASVVLGATRCVVIISTACAWRSGGYI